VRTIATLPPLFSRQDTNPLTEAGLRYEEVAFPAGDGLTLRGWFIPAARADAPAVGLCAGHRPGSSLWPVAGRAVPHGGPITSCCSATVARARADGNWLRFSYGDAESRDVDAAVQFLTKVRGVRQVAVLGYSAGAVSAILSAARNPQIGAVSGRGSYNCVDEGVADRPARR